MRAEIISIGDELTTGQRLDTNSQWLAERLLEIGVPVAFHTTVGDQLADNVLVFRQACERADICRRFENRGEVQSMFRATVHRGCRATWR